MLFKIMFNFLINSTNKVCANMLILSTIYLTIYLNHGMKMKCSKNIKYLDNILVSYRIELSGKCILLVSVLSQQIFEATDIRALCMSQLSDRPCFSSWVLNRPCYSSQISVTVLCYSSILLRNQQENISSRHEGIPTQR